MGPHEAAEHPPSTGEPGRDLKSQVFPEAPVLPSCVLPRAPPWAHHPGSQLALGRGPFSQDARARGAPGRGEGQWPP